jgi:two-component system, OmpR family, sensor histidine kinase MprB
MRRRLSIRTRLAIIGSAAVTATAVLVCTLAWLALRQTLVHQADQQLQQMSHGPAGQVDPRAIPSNPLAGPSDVRVQVRLPDGQILAGPQGTTPLPFGDRDRAVAAGTVEEARYTADTDQGRFRVLTRRGPLGETVQLAVSLADADTTLRDIGLLMIALVLGAAVLAAVAGRLVATAGLRPVNRLTQAATQIAETQDLQRPIPIDGTDEVGRLGRAFNRMLTALGTARQAQQQLIEDSAHELRTPMSSLRTNVELLIQAGDRLAATDRAALLTDLDRQSQELSNLVSDLVDLARSTAVDEPAVPVDLADVAAGATYRARARTPQARFELHTESVTVDARPAALERAIVNLLDNAVKFGPAEQTVEIHVGRVDGHAEVSVADRAPTIPEAEHDRIFERFHRLDTARAVPGSGLGLAIVRQTVSGHGGTATVEPRPAGGNIFRLRLPMFPGRAGRDT